MDITKFLEPKMFKKISHLPPEALKYLLTQISDMSPDTPERPQMLKIAELATKTLADQEKKLLPPEKRKYNLRRYFYLPFAKILFDGNLDERKAGMISRFAMEKIWFFILLKLMPDEIDEFELSFRMAVLEKEMKRAKIVVNEFNRLAGQKLNEIIVSSKQDYKEWTRFTMIIGNENIAADAEDLSFYLQNMRDVETALKFFPDEITELNGNYLHKATDEMLRLKKELPAFLPLYISLMLNSLKYPAHALRIILKYYRIDNASAAAQCDLAIIGEMILFKARVAANNFVTCEFDKKKPHKKLEYYKDYANIVLGVEREYDISAISSWGRDIIELRTQVSTELEKNITALGRQLKSTLGGFQKIPSGKAAAIPDPFDVVELTNNLHLLHGLKNYISASLCSAIYTEHYKRALGSIELYSKSIVELLRNEVGNKRNALFPYLELATELISIIKDESQAAIYHKGGLLAAKTAIIN